MDDAAATDEGTITITASGGVCAPLGIDYDLPGLNTLGRRPWDGALPIISAPREAITYLRPPEGGWGPPAPLTRAERLRRRWKHSRRVVGSRLHALARRVGNEPRHEPYDDDW